MFLWKDIHFRLAHKHTEFPVEASHPPSAIPEDCRWGPAGIPRTVLGIGKLLSFQSAFYPPFLFARPDSMTFVLLFLTAGYRDSEFQFSPLIIHLKCHYCQPFFTFRRRDMGYLLAGEE